MKMMAVFMAVGAISFVTPFQTRGANPHFVEGISNLYLRISQLGDHRIANLVHKQNQRKKQRDVEKN